MKQLIINEFRNKHFIDTIIREIKPFTREIKIMEVCGTHTMAIGHWGLRKLLPQNIKLISGPGCPVCVTPSSIIDNIIELGLNKNIIIASFGDLVRVPGKKTSLAYAKSQGLDIRVVYSPMDAIKFTSEKPTVFIGIGFETTAPTIAYTIKYAYENKIKNFYVLPLCKRIPEALDTLLSTNDVSINAFLLPGHVSAIIGSKIYNFIAQKYKVPAVISGFEPLDIIISIKMIISQIINNSPKIEVEYNRIVSLQGNIEAQNIINDVFYPGDAYWRGIGKIKNSGLLIKEKYLEYDASKKFNIDVENLKNEFEPAGCKCGDILKGKLIPTDCPLFKNVCTPENPIGPCMVSSEGSCAAYYRYEV